MPKSGRNKYDAAIEGWKASKDERDEWIRGWAENMVKYLREKMMSFPHPVYDTGALYGSLTDSLTLGMSTVIEHRFLEYGLYVAAGTGKGYRRGNSGRDDDQGLQFMRGGKYNKGKGHRQARDWFSKKYLYSLHRLNDYEAAYFGEAYQGLMSDALAAMFGDSEALAKHNNGNANAARMVANI